jgi:hypothetical protein
VGLEKRTSAAEAVRHKPFTARLKPCPSYRDAFSFSFLVVAPRQQFVRNAPSVPFVRQSLPKTSCAVQVDELKKSNLKSASVEKSLGSVSTLYGTVTLSLSSRLPRRAVGPERSGAEGPAVPRTLRGDVFRPSVPGFPATQYWTRPVCAFL